MSTDTADVVVVGGGIFGAATAYYLSKHVEHITLVEKTGIASQASGFSYGGLSPLSGIGIPGPQAPLAQFAFDLHKKLSHVMEAERQSNVHYRVVDSVDVAFTSKETVESLKKREWINQQDGFSAESLDETDIQKLDARLNIEALGGLLIRGPMQVDSAQLTATLIELSKAKVNIAECTSIDVENNEVTGVCLANGEHISTRNVVVATGPWLASLFANPFNFVEIYPLKGEILRMACPDAALEYTFGWGGNFVCTKPDGLIWAGTTETKCGFDSRITKSGRESVLASVKKVLPGLKIDKIDKQTACLRPMSRDGLVVLGKTESTKGLYVCGCGGRKGILYAPGVGKIVADLILNRNVAIDIAAFSPNRIASKARI